MKNLEPGSHCGWKMALIIIHVPILLITMAFNYLDTPVMAVRALFVSDTGTISDKYNTDITPAGWTFTIWAFIYTWQVIHAIYSLTLLCRKTTQGHYLYVYPGHIHYSFYIVYIINNGINIGWLFLFDREYMEVAFVFLFFIALTIYICGVLLCRSLNHAAAELEKSGQSKDIWLTRLLTLNGMAFYGTWCTIATLLNLCIVLQYRASVPATTCAYIALSILSAELLTWFILETFIFDRHLRYCFSPYIVLFTAFSGVISKHYIASSPEPYIYFVFVLLGLSAAFALVKILVMIIKGCKNPINYNNVLIVSTLSKDSGDLKTVA